MQQKSNVTNCTMLPNSLKGQSFMPNHNNYKIVAYGTNISFPTGKNSNSTFQTVLQNQGQAAVNHI
jgi:hypothetical protein